MASEIIDRDDRTLQDVSEMLTLAKLNENDMLPKTQAVYFSSKYNHNNNYKFLELNNHLLQNLTEGEVLRFAGDDDESVVMCSKNQTFNVFATETSNSLLLVTDLIFSEDINKQAERSISKTSVKGIFYEYLEVVVSKPHLGKLNELLQKTLYKGPEHEFELNTNDLLTHEDLLSTIQASEEELISSLSTLNTVTIDSYVRLLDFEYHFRVLSYMLKLIDENSWHLNEIDFETTVESLSEIVPMNVLENVFSLYTEESSIIDGVQMYRYKETEVCRFFAQVLLHSAGKFNLNEFLQAWAESVPEGMITREEMLHGVAIIDRKSNPSVVRAFPEDKLPENVMDRFKTLFEAKEKWTVSEIAPYIQGIATDKLDVNALLAKHTRVSNVNGVKHFSAKHCN